MDFTPATTATINTPDTDTEPPSPSDPKSNFINRSSLSFTNGALKPFRPTVIPPPQPPPLMAISYKECLKNHAASLGGHALDGCGEFMPSPSFNPSDPTSLKCAACGCHRNFHRRDNYHTPKHVLNHQHHHHRHRLLPAPPTHHHQVSSRSPSRSPSSSPGPTLSPQSPPPVSHLPPSFFASPTQMLLALSSGAAFPGPSGEQQQLPTPAVKHDKYVPNEKKRSRTKFSQEQKDKMCLFAEKVGWKMQKIDAGLVDEFCKELGIRRGVLKVWMHNNKHGQKRRSTAGGEGGSGTAARGGGVEHMIMSNVKYEMGNIGGDEEAAGGRGGGFMDAIKGDDRENANSYGVNAAANHHNEGSRAASYHLSTNGSSSSS